MAKVVKVCPICGKEFETTDKRIADGRGKYCSKKCTLKASRKRVRVKCSICGKSYTICLSHYKSKKTNKYYCPKCFKERNKKVERKCPICGKEFKIIQSQAKEINYCSAKCLAKSREKENVYFFRDDCIYILIDSEKYGKQYAIIDKEDYTKVKKYSWHLKINKYKNENGYYAYARKKGTKNKELALHRYITDCPKGMVVDHINHNPLDNRKINLRVCTQLQNNLNRKNQDKYKGIYKHGNKYRLNYRHKYIGLYNTKEEALEARKQAELNDKDSLLYYLQNK